MNQKFWQGPVVARCRELSALCSPARTGLLQLIPTCAGRELPLETHPRARHRLEVREEPDDVLAAASLSSDFS